MVLIGDEGYMGCPKPDEIKSVVSDKYRKFFIGSTIPQFTVYDLEKPFYESKVDEFNLFDLSGKANLIEYCSDITQALDFKKRTQLQFWIASFDKFDDSCQAGTSMNDAKT